MENTHGKADATASLPNTDATGYDEGALAVKVAVHIRPLIGNELLQGCKDCVSLVPGEPQVHSGFCLAFLVYTTTLVMCLCVNQSKGSSF